MFSISFKRLYYVSDKLIVRNLRKRNRLGSGANPGLQRRIDALAEEGIRVQDEDAEEYMDHSESEFFKAGEMYKQHLKEKIIDKDKLRHYIVKEKYFKEDMPNLLTWSEKEQIRHLATTFPGEWTPEKIAESFPITVSVAKKLLKYPWKPATVQRIARHDESAMRNWRELKEGTLPIPEDLRQHFLKFSNRTIPPLNKKSIKVEVTKEEDLGEFESIIQRCAEKAEKSERNQNIMSTEETSLTIRNHKEKKRDDQKFTLEELTAKIRNRLELGNEVDLADKLMVDTKIVSTKEIETIGNEINHEIDLYNKDSVKEVTEYKENNSDLKIADYPLRIRIPKKAYKKGATYKINDCYYDHDGHFLYRVVGMSN